MSEEALLDMDESDFTQDEIDFATNERLDDDERFEVTLSQLEEHFGGYVFTYKTHSGTVRQLLDCPVFETYIRIGFDAAANWLMTHDGTEVEEDVLEAEKTTADKAPEDDQVIVNEVQKPALEADQSNTTKVKSSETASVVNEPIDQAVSDVPEVNQSTSGDTVAEAPSPGVALTKTQASIDKDTVVLAKQNTIEDNKTVHLTDKELVHDTQDGPKLAGATAAALGEVVEAEELIQKVYGMDEPQLVEVANGAEEFKLEEIIDEAKIDKVQTEKHFDGVVLGVDEETEIPTNADELGESEVEHESQQESTEIYSGIQPHESAESDSYNEYGTETQVEDVDKSDENLGAERPKAEVATDEATVLSEFEQIIANEQIEHGIDEPPDAPLAIDIVVEMVGDQPEHEVVEDATLNAQATQVIRVAERLEAARTAEDCKHALEQIRLELAVLLEQLGYTNAEAVAEHLIKTYDILTLKQYILLLIQTLQHATTRRENVKTVRLNVSGSKHLYGVVAVRRVVELVHHYAYS